MRAPRSDDEASRRATRVSYRSSFREVSLLLEFASNGTVVPALLRRHGLDRVYTWMRNGIEFDTIFRVVWVHGRMDGKFASVKSWSFYAAAIEQRHQEDVRGRARPWEL
jgi:hypothetical protein